MRKLIALLITLLVIPPALAQQVNESAYERYINKANYNQMFPGFYLQGNASFKAVTINAASRWCKSSG